MPRLPPEAAGGYGFDGLILGGTIVAALRLWSDDLTAINLAPSLLEPR